MVLSTILWSLVGISVPYFNEAKTCNALLSWAKPKYTINLCLINPLYGRFLSNLLWNHIKIWGFLFNYLGSKLVRFKDRLKYMRWANWWEARRCLIHQMEPCDCWKSVGSLSLAPWAQAKRPKRVDRLRWSLQDNIREFGVMLFSTTYLI